METPPIILTRLPDTQRRMSVTSQLFTRLDKNSTCRESKTSKVARAFPHSIKNQSLDNTKQNINYQNYLHKIKSALKVDEKETASKYLLSLRKQFDKMAKNIKQQSSGINIMKKQIQFMKNKIKTQQQSHQNAKYKVQAKQNDLECIQAKQQQARMQTKRLQHIIWRMKEDQLKKKNETRLKQIVMKDKKKQLKSKQDQVLQWDESIHKIFQQMSKIKQDFKKNSQQRELKLKDYKSHMFDLQQQQKFELERKQRTFELLSMESTDIMDAKNVVLRDVLMTNKVLDKLLQSKINDLLNHYQTLQNSYHMIKTQTNISDPIALAKKFFSYSESLQELTSTIGYYEQKQQQLNQRNKQLKEIEKQRIIKKLQEDKILTDKLKESQQQKQKLNQQCLEKELAVKKIKTWTDKMMDMLGCKKKQMDDYPLKMSLICDYLVKRAEQTQNENLIDRKFQSPGIRLKKIIKQFSIQQQKLRRSEAQQINQSNMFQNAYLSYQRKKVKKNQFLIKTQVSNKMVKQ